MEPAVCGVLSCHGSETMMGVTILASMWRVAPRKCIWDAFQLDWFVVKPLVSEFSDGWLLEEELLEDGKSVVHISSHK